jgi:hypothetical protein
MLNVALRLVELGMIDGIPRGLLVRIATKQEESAR